MSQISLEAINYIGKSIGTLPEAYLPFDPIVDDEKKQKNEK